MLVRIVRSLSVIICRKTVIFGVIYCAYLYGMFSLYLNYKLLDPAIPASMSKNQPYLIDTEGYKLPDFDPFDESIKRFMKTSPEIDCSDGKRPLTTGISNFEIQNSSSIPTSAVVIHKEHLQDYGVRRYSCCYQGIRRNASGDSNFEMYLQDPKYDYEDAKFYVEKTCHKMNYTITSTEEEAVLVTCSSDSEIFYRNIHFFVSLKRGSVARPKRPSNASDQISVMIVGIDSISRMNMHRYMPETLKYLRKIEAIDLKGFNKNFENTYPNLFAMLSGWSTQEERFQKYFIKAERYFDGVPFLWKNFSNVGYTTIYGEDCSFLGTFAYKNKKGFKKPPTDYYFRPYIKASEDILGSNKGIVWISACQLCGGSKLLLQHIFDYAGSTAKAFHKIKPYFSLFWTTSLTHEKLYFAGTAEKPALKFLKDMNENGYWNNTIVFFMSDHGIRYGGVRETFLGKLEESLPFNFIIIPTWFKEKYPIIYENLLHNQNRLTTTMDLHETLKDILTEKYKEENYVKLVHSNRRKWLSLFRKIPSTRTCINADIPLNYCAGQVAVDVPETHLVRLAATSILSTLNKGLEKFPMCHQLSNFEIRKKFILKFYETNVISNYTYYEIQMTTYPGEALLEAIVKIQFTRSNTYTPSIIGDISRINKYGNTSYCVNDFIYSKYCVCR